MGPRRLTGPRHRPVESAISADERLADEQKAALIAVYRSILRSWRTSPPLLRYLPEPRLREQITQVTSRNEAFHGFAGWLIINNPRVP